MKKFIMILALIAISFGCKKVCTTCYTVTMMTSDKSYFDVMIKHFYNISADSIKKIVDGGTSVKIIDVAQDSLGHSFLADTIYTRTKCESE